MNKKILIGIFIVSFILIGQATAQAELFGLGGGASVYFLNLAGVNGDLPDLTGHFPVPILEGRIQIILPLIFIDTLRLEGGGLAVGLDLNQYMDIPSGQQINLNLTTSFFSLTLLKQFNIPFVGVYLGLGGDLIKGQAVITVDNTSDKSFRWNKTTIHGLGGFHLIFGFLRLYVEGKALQPIIQNPAALPLFPWQIGAGVMLSF